MAKENDTSKEKPHLPVMIGVGGPFVIGACLAATLFSDYLPKPLHDALNPDYSGSQKDLTPALTSTNLESCQIPVGDPANFGAQESLDATHQGFTVGGTIVKFNHDNPIAYATGLQNGLVFCEFNVDGDAITNVIHVANASAGQDARATLLQPIAADINGYDCFSNIPTKPAQGISVCLDNKEHIYTTYNALKVKVKKDQDPAVVKAAQVAKDLERFEGQLAKTQGLPITKVKSIPTPTPTPTAAPTAEAKPKAVVAQPQNATESDFPTLPVIGGGLMLAAATVGYVGYRIKRAINSIRKNAAQTLSEANQTASQREADIKAKLNKTEADLAKTRHEANVHAKNLKDATEAKARLAELEKLLDRAKAELTSFVNERETTLETYTQQYNIKHAEYLIDLKNYQELVAVNPNTKTKKPVAPQDPSDFIKNHSITKRIKNAQRSISTLEEKIETEMRRLKAISVLVK